MVVNTALLILSALIIGFLRGGSFKNLAAVKIRFMWIAVAAFAMQYAAFFIIPGHVQAVDVVTYAALLYFAFMNRNNMGILLVLLGAVMNYVVMLVNDGRMPVYVPYAKLVASKQAVASLLAGNYGKQIAMSSHTHLNYLGDLFYFGHPFPNPTLLSAGDLVVAIGIFYFIQIAMKQPENEGRGDM